MREVRDRLVAHLPALTPRAAQQMRLVVPRRTVLTHIVTTVCSHVYGPTTFSHTTKLPDRHIDSVTISDDTPDASDTTSPQVTQRINPQRARNFGLGGTRMQVRKKPTLLAQGKPRNLGGSARPWRVRLYAPESGSTKYQVMFRAPAGEGEPWKRVLRRANSEAEARKIFAQAEAALDTEKEAPARADVRAARTIGMLGEESLKASVERGKQPRTMEQRESKLNAHILPTIGEVPVAKWRVEHSRKVLAKWS